MSFDYSKTYWKVVKKNHTHHGFKYKKGLNTDTNPFSYKGSCVEGGLYFFEDLKEVSKWLSYGEYLYEVKVPEGTPVVKDPDGDKYRAHQLILGKRRSFSSVSTYKFLKSQKVARSDRLVTYAFGKCKLSLTKYLVENGADIHTSRDYALKNSAEQGHFELVKYLVEHGANIHASRGYALRSAAIGGYLKVLKYLVSKGADIHVSNDLALRWSAEKGHFEIVKYLVENGADIHACDNYALRISAAYGHLELVKYLVENGADIHAEEDFALRWAEKKGHKEVAGYLRPLGATVDATI